MIAYCAKTWQKQIYFEHQRPLLVSESGEWPDYLCGPVRRSLFRGRQNQAISALISRKGSPHRSDIVSRSRSSL